MLNKLIISFLAISLVAVPAATSVALKIKADSLVGGQPMNAMRADIPNTDSDGFLPKTAKGSSSPAVEVEECHKMDEIDCCKNECGCCVAHFFPMSANPLFAISIFLPTNVFQPIGLPDPQVDRLNQHG